MKKSLLLSLMLFLGISLTACEDANANSDLEGLSEKVESQNSEPQNSTFSNGWGFKYRAEAILVDYGKIRDCYTVRVSVIITDMSTGEDLLVASENVQVGNGCPKKAAKAVENRCEPGYLPNGDYVMSSDMGDEYKECLRDLLLNNEELYGQYIQVTRQLINNL